MAPTLLVIALAFAISMQASQGKIIDCKDLGSDLCPYAVSPTGKRCVLDKSMFGYTYTCRSSEIEADKKLRGWLETKECIDACSVERRALGISFDSLLENGFAERLCSYECYDSCPNIVDLYFNLAAGEGVFLPKFCEARRKSCTRRRIIIFSVGDDGKAASPPPPMSAQAKGLSMSEAAVFPSEAPATRKPRPLHKSLLII